MLTLAMSEEAPNVLNEKADERPACLVLHGLGGGPYELAPLLGALQTDGLTVKCPVLPGHDGPGPVMPASRWDEWAAAAETGFDELAASGSKVAVVGFSTGATVALHLATRRPVERLVLLAPFLAIRYAGLIPLRPAAYLRWLARLVPDLPRRAPAVRDREMRGQASEANVYRTFSVPAALSALELIDELLPEISRIQTPTLIIQGERDTVVEPAHAGWLHHNLGSAHKRLVYLDQSDHLVALDCQRDRAISETLAFLRGHHAPGDFPSRGA
ncbi:MAG: alpha/beta hydrolase [Isosphaeraceae bacterium]